MAPRRPHQEVQAKKLVGKKHGSDLGRGTGEASPVKVPRCRPRLREKELKQTENQPSPCSGNMAQVETPKSANPRLRKKLEGMFEEPDQNENEVDVKKAGRAKANEKNLDKEKFGEGKRDQPCVETVGDGAQNNMDSLKGEGDRGIGASSAMVEPFPYVEVFLPDGRLARKCQTSDHCPQQFRFELVRLRMERHLKTDHGLDVVIPLHKGGRRSNAELGSRAKPPNARDSAQWHKQAKMRFEDRDRKFALSLKKTERLHRLRATKKWDKLRPEFRRVSKVEFVEKIVKERMAAYLASSKERMDRIQQEYHGHSFEFTYYYIMLYYYIWCCMFALLVIVHLKVDCLSECGPSLLRRV
ncbi:hypothetical protein GOP47_0021410 [Adiantum capillus-veneris]|uniref:Uncharacterized protein n=1 Tax=Adiantum capillus-veneris TaxID=13818 RepID=A0A9D4U7F9_ADICA|nr:hypothetical protein GOP47_0021410 [Adiantum capillus-veneris]